MFISSTNVVIVTFVFGWVLSIFEIFNVGGVSVTLLLILPLLLFLPYNKECSGLTRLVLFLLVVSLITPIILNVSAIDLSTFTHLIQSIVCLVVFFIFSTIKLSNRVVDNLVNIIVISVFLCCIYGVYQFFARLNSLPFDYLPMTNLQISADEGMQRGYSNRYLHGIIFTRVSSFFSEPSEFGRFLLLTFPFVFYCYKGNNKIKLLVLSLVAVSLLLTQSLASMLIALIALTIYFLKNGRRHVTVFIVIFPLIILISWLLVYFNIVQLGSLDRFEKIYELGWKYLDSTARFKDTFTVLEIASDNLISGLGIGRISDVVSNYVVANLILLLLIERGLVCTLLFLSVYLSPLFFERKSKFDEAMFYVIVIQLLFFVNFSMMYFIPMYALLGLSYNKTIKE